MCRHKYHVACLRNSQAHNQNFLIFIQIVSAMLSLSTLSRILNSPPSATHGMKEKCFSLSGCKRKCFDREKKGVDFQWVKNVYKKGLKDTVNSFVWLIVKSDTEELTSWRRYCRNKLNYEDKNSANSAEHNFKFSLFITCKCEI